MLAELLHSTHFLKRFVFVSLPYHVWSRISKGWLKVSFTLYLCIVGKDLGTFISVPVSGSFRYGPNFLKACLADFNLNFLASVFASDSLNIHMRFWVSTLFAANV